MLPRSTLADVPRSVMIIPLALSQMTLPPPMSPVPLDRLSPIWFADDPSDIKIPAKLNPRITKPRIETPETFFNHNPLGKMGLSARLCPLRTTPPWLASIVNSSISIGGRADCSEMVSTEDAENTSSSNIIVSPVDAVRKACRRVDGPSSAGSDTIHTRVCALAAFACDNCTITIPNMRMMQVTLPRRHLLAGWRRIIGDALTIIE